MNADVLEAALRRDRAIVGMALVSVTLLAWAYLVWLGHTMDMSPNMSQGAMPMAASPWTAAEFALMFVMWAVMMVGMMTPSATPMILIYARVARQASARASALAPTTWFAAGYLLAWTAFSLVATLAQWALHAALLLTPMMSSASPILSSLLLIAAGIFQWTPLKRACLSHCQAPLLFIQRHGGFRPGTSGAITMGLRHGVYCVGCCSALMTLLFVGGVMNLLWIALISILVLAEKIAPPGRWFSRLTGALLAGWGVALLLRMLN